MEKHRKEELAESLRESYARYCHIAEHGCSDPLYEDGTNLNLVRNHIINYKRQCETELATADYPKEYYLDTPEEVEQHYMVRPEEIRKQAKEALRTYEADKNYRYLRNVVNGLTEEQGKATYIYRVLSYTTALRESIEKDDLVAMRRHRTCYAVDSFKECRKRVESILGAAKEEPVLPEGQLSLFDLFGLTMCGT